MHPRFPYGLETNAAWDESQTYESGDASEHSKPPSPPHGRKWSSPEASSADQREKGRPRRTCGRQETGMLAQLWRRLRGGDRTIRQQPDWPRFAGPDWAERIMALPVTDRLHQK